MKVFLTLWYKDFRRSGLVKEVVEGGFDGFELSLDYPLCGLVRLAELGQLKALADLGLRMGVHLPWREVYLASPIDSIRETSLRHVLGCLEEVSRLDPEYAVVHVSTDQAACSENLAECVSASSRSVEALAERLREVGIPLYVETTRGYCCGGLEQLVAYLGEGVYVCLDLPHAVERYSRLYRRPVAVEDVLKEAPPRALEAVRCVHLHGFVMSGYYVVESHLEPSRELLEAYLSILRRGIVKPEYTVLESFFSSETKRPLSFGRLRWCVEELKKGHRGGR